MSQCVGGSTTTGTRPSPAPSFLNCIASITSVTPRQPRDTSHQHRVTSFCRTSLRLNKLQRLYSNHAGSADPLNCPIVAIRLTPPSQPSDLSNRRETRLAFSSTHKLLLSAALQLAMNFQWNSGNSVVRHQYYACDLPSAESSCSM